MLVVSTPKERSEWARLLEALGTFFELCIVDAGQIPYARPSIPWPDTVPAPGAILFLIALYPSQVTDDCIRCLKCICVDTPVFECLCQERVSCVRAVHNNRVMQLIVAPGQEGAVARTIYEKSLSRSQAARDSLRLLKEKLGLKQLVGESPTLLDQLQKIPILAKYDVPVLITGETGTGKEIVARAVHYLSPRSGKPFVPVNCGGIPIDLFENELFGHMQGAYTGASTPGPGLVHEAQGGSLFLDEVDCLSPMGQTKLLRLLQEKEYRSVGSTKTVQADIRFIAATNNCLETETRSGRFRADLYYRLHVLTVSMPSLRDRRSDIALLATHFLHKYSKEFGRTIVDFDSSALHRLISYDWPGNVRELENTIERAVVLASHDTILEEDIILPAMEQEQASLHAMRAKMVHHFERTYIENLLTVHNGNITRAAEAARENRRTFVRLLRKHGIKSFGLPRDQY